MIHKLMRAWILGGVLLAFIWGCALNSNTAVVNWALAIHGGAGVIERASMTRDNEAAYRAALSSALETASSADPLSGLWRMIPYSTQDGAPCSPRQDETNSTRRLWTARTSTPELLRA